MLNALRRGAKSILAKILIALLVLSFAVWGISDFVNQIDPTEVARAGDTPVSATEYSRAYSRAIGSASQRMGIGLTPQQAQAFGIPTQVLSQLVTEALQVDAARELGVDLGDDALAGRIRNDATFAGGNGAFDRLRFDQILADNRYSEAEFIEIQRAAAAQEMLVNGLVGGLRSPTTYLEAFNRFQNQTRSVAMVTLTEDALGPIADPTEQELRTFFEDNKADFRAPEYRSLSTVTLSAEAIADPDSVSEDAVRRAYQSGGAYGTPERRRVQQFINDDLAAAQEAAAAINAGTAFEEVLAAHDKSPEDVDLGLVERSDLVDPAIAEAAFSLEAGRASAVEGRFGPALVRVSEIIAAGKQPFEAVEADIRSELALDEAGDEMRAIFDSVEDAVAGGASIQEIAERFSLPTRTIEVVDREGNGRDGAPLVPPVEAAVLSGAFDVQTGADAERVDLGDSTRWVQVDSVIEAADQAFEAVEGDVLVAWTQKQKEDRLAALAEEALQAVENGETVEAVAAQYGADATQTEPFSQAAPAEDLPQEATGAAFGGPVGHVASVATNDGRHIVLKVTEVSEPAFFEEDATLQAARTSLDQSLAETLLYEFVTARQADVGATVNQPVLNQIIGAGEGLPQY